MTKRRSTPTEEPMWEDLRRARIKKDKGICTLCGKSYENPVASRLHMTAQRVKPYAPDTIDNLRTVCKRHLPKEER